MRGASSEVQGICALTHLLQGAHASAVGRGTALQAGRSRGRFSMGSLRFVIDLILPAAL